MKHFKLLSILLAFILITGFNSDKPAYRLFDSNGKQVKYKKLLKAAENADVILFGELHNNPVCHWLQLELTKDIYNLKNKDLILGAEMFEADNQLILDEYVSGKISQKNFENEAKLWNNYKTDYKPLIEFAKENELIFVANNIPRRYAAIVHKKGFDGLNDLDDEAKKFIAPLPFGYDPELPGYKAMMSMMGGMGKGKGHTNENLPKAQASKDATMAYFITENLQPGKVFLHFNGTYHSNNFEGISWYLKKTFPELIILTISSVEQADIENLDEEYLNQANFIICIPETMTKTY